MNISFKSPSKELYYKVTIKTYDKRTKILNNVFTYDQYISPKKENLFGYVIIIRRDNVLLNNTKDQTPVNEILFITAKVLESLELEVSVKGEILKIRNLKDIQKYWKEIRFKIDSTYLGDIVSKIVEPMENTIMDEKALIRSLDKDPFFHFYFNEIFHNYPEDRIRTNNISRSFLLNRPVNVQSKGKITIYENGEKQLDVNQCVDSCDLMLLQEEMQKQEDRGTLDMEMKNIYLISSSQYIKSIEVDHKISWNEQLIKRMNMNVKLVSQ